MHVSLSASAGSELKHESRHDLLAQAAQLSTATTYLPVTVYQHHLDIEAHVLRVYISAQSVT